MSKYFFHIHNGFDIRDGSGVKFMGVRDARLHMLNLAMQEFMSATAQTDPWSIEVLDERGMVVGAINSGASASNDNWQRL